MTGKYESMIILAPNLSAEEMEKENTKILELVSSLGGEYVKTDIWGKKQLAYEIQKFIEGYYIINYFNLNTLKINEIEKYYRINERIIRYNIIKLEAEEV
jgi:small subunit ribosomal protein S6